MAQFSEIAVSKSISLPADMWKYFDVIRDRDGTPVSAQIRLLLESAIMDRARRLVDTRVPYEVQE